MNIFERIHDMTVATMNRLGGKTYTREQAKDFEKYLSKYGSGIEVEKGFALWEVSRYNEAYSRNHPRPDPQGRPDGYLLSDDQLRALLEMWENGLHYWDRQNLDREDPHNTCVFDGIREYIESWLGDYATPKTAKRFLRWLLFEQHVACGGTKEHPLFWWVYTGIQDASGKFTYADLDKTAMDTLFDQWLQKNNTPLEPGSRDIDAKDKEQLDAVIKIFCVSEPYARRILEQLESLNDSAPLYYLPPQRGSKYGRFMGCDKYTLDLLKHLMDDPYMFFKIQAIESERYPTCPKPGFYRV